MTWWKDADEIEVAEVVDEIEVAEVADEIEEEVREVLGRPADTDTDPTEEFPTVEYCTNCDVVKPEGAPWCSSCGFNF